MFKIIETERLIMRAWQKKDAEALFAYAKNPNVGPKAGWKPHQNIEESLMIIKKLFIPNNVWAIVLKESGAIVGSIGYEDDIHRPKLASKELGYSLREESWGQGIMTEAAKAVIEYGFKDLGLEVISILTSPINHRSQGVIKNCGFKYEGTIRKCCLEYDGCFRDSQIYSLLKEEWESLKTQFAKREGSNFLI